MAAGCGDFAAGQVSRRALSGPCQCLLECILLQAFFGALLLSNLTLCVLYCRGHWPALRHPPSQLRRTSAHHHCSCGRGWWAPRGFWHLGFWAGPGQAVPECEFRIRCSSSCCGRWCWWWWGRARWGSDNTTTTGVCQWAHSARGWPGKAKQWGPEPDEADQWSTGLGRRLAATAGIWAGVGTGVGPDTCGQEPGPFLSSTKACWL